MYVGLYTELNNFDTPKDANLFLAGQVATLQEVSIVDVVEEEGIPLSTSYDLLNVRNIKMFYNKSQYWNWYIGVRIGADRNTDRVETCIQESQTGLHLSKYLDYKKLQETLALYSFRLDEQEY